MKENYPNLLEVLLRSDARVHENHRSADTSTGKDDLLLGESVADLPVLFVLDGKRLVVFVYQHLRCGGTCK